LFSFSHFCTSDAFQWPIFSDPAGSRDNGAAAVVLVTGSAAGIGASLFLPSAANAQSPTMLETWRPIYKMSYDLSYDYRKFIVTSTYDSDLKCAEISLRNIVS